MLQKKLPRDFFGIVFYVLGWTVGAILKTIGYAVRFLAKALYQAFKRDQFNRRVRLTVTRIEKSKRVQQREFGREQLRFLAAGCGLTNADWHKSVKVRAHLSEVIVKVGETAIESGDLSSEEASVWVKQTTNLLFANFDRNQLKLEKKPFKRRYRLSRRASALENRRNRSTVLPLTTEVEKRIQPTGKLVQSPTAAKKDATSRQTRNFGNLKAENFSASATEWAQDEDSSSTIEEQ